MSAAKCPIPKFPNVKLTHAQCLGIFAGIAAAVIGWSSWKKQRSGGLALKKVVDEKESMAEGGAGEITAFMSRICAVFAKMDLDNSDSIEMSELESLGYSKEEAAYLMSTLDEDKNGSISCDELLAHFMKIKKDYGLDKMLEHVTLFEDAVNNYKPSAAAAAAPKQANKEDLPSTWMPTLMARIGAIFKRIDMDGDNAIDKAELLALQHGNEAEAKAMFADLDADGDGSITAHEFMDYFLSLLKKIAKTDDLSKAKAKKVEKAKTMVNKILANLEQKLNNRDAAM